jgi:hypothetical protein
MGKGCSVIVLRLHVGLEYSGDSNPPDHRAGLLLQCVAEFTVMSSKAEHSENAPPPTPVAEAAETGKPAPPKEIGGRDGPEPVRYGDWEKNGRCIDF